MKKNPDNRPNPTKPAKVASVPAQPAASPRRARLLALAAFLFPVLLYVQTASYDIVYFDDELISKNLPFLSDMGNAPAAFATDAFLEKASPFYRPIQTVSYMADMQLAGGYHPWVFHATHILLIGGIGCALFLLLMRFRFPPMLSLLSALLYCAHPLFVSSVAWIPARGDLFLMLASLLSLLFLMDYLRTAKPLLLVAHIAAFVVALFSKETAALLPVLFVAYSYCYTEERLFGKKSLLLAAAYGLLGLGWYAVRARAIHMPEGRGDVFGVHAVAANIRTLPESLCQFFLPVDVAPIPGFTLWHALAGGAILLGLVWLVVRPGDKPLKEKAFGLLWFLLLLAPTMLFKHVLIDYLNHRFFLPMLGVLLVVLFSLPTAWLSRHAQRLHSALAALVVVFAALTVQGTRAYRDPIAFYSAAIAHNGHSAMSHNNRGTQLVGKNDLQAAQRDFSDAIALYPRYDMAYHNRGYVKSALGDKKGAVADFKQAIAIRSRYPEPYYHSGLAYISLGQFQAAVEALNGYVQLRPNDPQAYNYRGTATGSLDNLAGAIADFDKAIAISPNYLEAIGNRSIARYRLKDYPGALADCDKVLALSPKNPNAVALMAAIAQEQGGGRK